MLNLRNVGIANQEQNELPAPGPSVGHRPVMAGIAGMPERAGLAMQITPGRIESGPKENPERVYCAV
ncbi:hypothetical protein LRN22_004165 [Salmonella enterica]|nr:hypothetical protein [Salmonella enterica]